MITLSAPNKIKQYNERGLHYNLVANAVYEMRSAVADPFDSDYLPYIVAALLSFDMGRLMGSGGSKYNTKTDGFAHCLRIKLNAIKPYITHLVNSQLDTLSIRSETKNIKRAYDILSSAGEKCLNQNGDEFHVGATKIFHFINPHAFIIVDSNAARAFKLSHHVSFRNTASARIFKRQIHRLYGACQERYS